MSGLAERNPEYEVTVDTSSDGGSIKMSSVVDGEYGEKGDITHITFNFDWDGSEIAIDMSSVYLHCAINSHWLSIPVSDFSQAVLENIDVLTDLK